MVIDRRLYAPIAPRHCPYAHYTASEWVEQCSTSGDTLREEVEAIVDELLDERLENFFGKLSFVVTRKE